MRRRLLVLFSITSASLAGLVMACVGDVGTNSAPAVGALGGACFANGSCSGSLACVLTGSVGKCEQATNDATTDTSTTKDQSAPDVITDAAVGPDAFDAGPKCGVSFTPPAWTCNPGYFACYDDKGAGHKCSASTNDCLNQAYTAPIEFGCFSQLECKSGDFCCGSFSQVDTTQCPGTIKFGPSGGGACGATIQTPGSCPKGQVVLCSSSAACPDGGTCWPVVAADPPTLASQSFGVCR